MYNSSRSTVANKQQNRNYRPNNRPALHVGNETRYIDSTSTVIHSVDGYYVASKKFVQRYYRVTVDEQGNWGTSATNERVARDLIAQVQVYRMLV